MSKTVILPIIALIALAIQAVTGKQIDQDVQNHVADAVVILVTFVVSVIGIFKNFKKDKK
jgi:hypothetical protein